MMKAFILTARIAIRPYTTLTTMLAWDSSGVVCWGRVWFRPGCRRIEFIYDWVNTRVIVNGPNAIRSVDCSCLCCAFRFACTALYRLPSLVCGAGELVYERGGGHSHYRRKQTTAWPHVNCIQVSTDIILFVIYETLFAKNYGSTNWREKYKQQKTETERDSQVT